MHIIIYSGSQNLNSLGATKSIDVMLVKNLVLNGCKVTWIGRGNISDPPCEYINLGKNKIGELMYKIISKLRRIFFKIKIQDILYEEFIYFDKRMASLIISGRINVDNETIIIGRNSMSLNSFSEVKKRGGKTILHSQWMHPITQEKLLNSEFKKIGINSKAINQKRIKRQLLEIDNVDLIWCISKLVKDSYISNGLKINKLIDLNLGVDFEKYSNVDKNLRSKNEFTVLFVGNVNPEKGVYVLLEAIKKTNIKNIKVIFNGAIPKYFKSIFDNKVKELHNKNINFVVSPGNPIKNYAAASVFVLPSIHESFGLVVLEAMSAALPVIISDMVGAKDCVKEGVNGFVFKSGNSDELAQILCKFYKNPRLVEQMGRQSSLIAKNFDWNIIVFELLRLIRSLNK